MILNIYSQKSDIARFLVIGILKNINHGLKKCSLTFSICKDQSAKKSKEYPDIQTACIQNGHSTLRATENDLSL